jgi:hypothetical protein
MKSKANPDTQARVSERTRTRVSEAPTATVAAPHHTPRAGYDNLSGSEIKIAPIHRMKSKIDGDKSSRSARALTRTRTRARARVVVVPFRNNINKSVPASRIKQQQQPEHFRASRAIFADAHVEGRSLVQLARTVEADLARQWTDRLADAPASFTDPVGYMIRHLLEDPTEAPPYAWQRPKKPSLFDADFARFVHGRPEHTQYCREHPELVDCECGV